MAHPKLPLVVKKAQASLDPALARLAAFLKIPAISCDPEHKGDVRKLAEHVRADLEKVGFERCRLLDLAEKENAHPCVAAEWMKAGADKPTVLIYGHLDLQPVKGEPWDTAPHELVKKGERVYGRGSADDMGGWVSHLVALECWLSEAGSLPCNVKLLIEGEEEIGSPNLEKFMDAFPDAFQSDVMVLTDCENPSPEIPGLTVSLRGLLEVDLTVTSATSDVHSGLWGNIVPDPCMLLTKLIARLVDDDGRMVLGRMPVDPAWLARSKEVPLTPAVIKEGAHLADGVSPLPDGALTPAAWIWRQPAVTILSTTFPPPGREKNAIRKSASAVLSVRLAPGQDREQMMKLLRDALLVNAPSGVKVDLVERPGGSMSWDYKPKGPAFAAANRAYEKAWGKPLMEIGVGGSIPFVALFGRRFGDLPLILNGVMDPNTTAHGPNESMHTGVFHKAILANVHLLDELAALPR
jgi:acetylornithine deacetylase/succinyl-diaminopimelate desuccinylase-like protein